MSKKYFIQNKVYVTTPKQEFKMIRIAIFTGILAILSGCATSSGLDRAVADGGVIVTTPRINLVGDDGLTESGTSGGYMVYWGPDGRKVVKITRSNKITTLKWYLNDAGEFCQESYSQKGQVFCGDESGIVLVKLKNGNYANFKDGKMTDSGTFKLESGNINNL